MLSSMSLVLMTSCENTREIKCGWAGEVLPVYTSSKDKLTENTARQILDVNESFENICVKPPEPKKCFINGIELSKEACS